jgi:hypothetical protein
VEGGLEVLAAGADGPGHADRHGARAGLHAGSDHRSRRTGRRQGIQFTAEDWPFGVASATLYRPQGNTGHRPNNTVDPGDTTTPVIFNGPGSLTINTLEVWIAASGGQYWGGCEVWLSVDGGVTYRKSARSTRRRPSAS